jgi:hypothetical protein
MERVAMSTLKYGLVLAAALAAGCASAPEELTANATAPASVAPLEEAEPVEVTLDEISLDPGSVVICREMLKQGSNVITTMCMSRDDWKRYERRMAQDAAEIVRFLQGSAYR